MPRRRRADVPQVTTANGFDEASFRRWYAQKARDLNLNPNPDAPEQFYDYRSAFLAHAEPNDSGHWPSQFKRPGHPNEVVGGFNTRTGARVEGTPRAGEQTLRHLGWDDPAAAQLAQLPGPAGIDMMSSHLNLQQLADDVARFLAFHGVERPMLGPLGKLRR